MSTCVKLKPKAGLLVRDPVTAQPLDPNGQEKELNTYWRRRLRDGDVELCNPAAASLKMARPPARKGKKAH